MKSAVEKWNDEVSEANVVKYVEEVTLIAEKLSHLPHYDERVNGVKLSESVAGLTLPPYTTDKIMTLMSDYQKFLEGLYMTNAMELICATCDKDLQRMAKVYTRGDQLLKRFQNSFKLNESNLKNMRGVEQRSELKIVDDAILGFSRILPDRRVSPTGSLVLRDLQRVYHPKVNAEDLELMKKRFSSMYIIKSYSSVFTYTSVLLIPRMNFISEDSLKEIYDGINVATLTIFELMKLDVPEWWVKEDPNVSPASILNKILGSSITSISTVITQLMVYLFQVLKSDGTNEGLSDEEINAKLSSGPWTSIESTLLFISPIDLYESFQNSERVRQGVKKDFLLMLNFLEIYRLHRSDYGDEVFRIKTSAPARVNSETYRSSEKTVKYEDNKFVGSGRFNRLLTDPDCSHQVFMLLGHSWHAANRLSMTGHTGEASNVMNALKIIQNKLGYDENKCVFDQ